MRILIVHPAVRSRDRRRKSHNSFTVALQISLCLLTFRLVRQVRGDGALNSNNYQASDKAEEGAEAGTEDKSVFGPFMQAKLLFMSRGTFTKAPYVIREIYPGDQCAKRSNQEGKEEDGLPD